MSIAFFSMSAETKEREIHHFTHGSLSQTNGKRIPIDVTFSEPCTGLGGFHCINSSNCDLPWKNYDTWFSVWEIEKLEERSNGLSSVEYSYNKDQQHSDFMNLSYVDHKQSFQSENTTKYGRLHNHHDINKERGDHLKAASTFVIKVFLFLIIAIYSESFAQYNESNQVTNEEKWYRNLLFFFIGRPTTGKWFDKNGVPSSFLARFGILFDDWKGPPVFILGDQNESNSITKWTESGQSEITRTKTVSLEDNNEETKISEFKRVLGCMRASYIIIDLLRRVGLGIISVAYPSENSNKSLFALIITSIQFIYLFTTKPYISRSVQVVEAHPATMSLKEHSLQPEIGANSHIEVEGKWLKGHKVGLRKELKMLRELAKASFSGDTRVNEASTTSYTSGDQNESNSITKWTESGQSEITRTKTVSLEDNNEETKISEFKRNGSNSVEAKTWELVILFLLLFTFIAQLTNQCQGTHPAFSSKQALSLCKFQAHPATMSLKEHSLQPEIGANSHIEVEGKWLKGHKVGLRKELKMLRELAKASFSGDTRVNEASTTSYTSGEQYSSVQSRRGYLQFRFQTNPFHSFIIFPSASASLIFY
ncbi:hypothetical protein DEO72_LG10g1791 [Vigna unguiculata]|uniref:Uncharacterized protein n=1 Tax=Vigna unguiculata TaxID=3917 RepID=A0A4D6NCE5_VIGUN|nr:hypothetical protein DEO72_LG10g1791 [Vigna unguiculata]